MPFFFLPFSFFGDKVLSHAQAANPKYFGAALGDISRDISPGRCEGPQGPNYDLTIWYNSFS